MNIRDYESEITRGRVIEIYLDDVPIEILVYSPEKIRYRSADAPAESDRTEDGEDSSPHPTDDCVPDDG